MNPMYTAKVYLEDDQMIEHSGDNIEELTAWINSQAETSFTDVKGEIFDNKLHKVIKTIQYSPPEV